MKIKIKNQSGLTMIELMVSLLIGAIMMTGIITVFINSNKTNRIVTNKSRMQEDIRFVTTVIKDTVSLTGYQRDARLPKEQAFPSYTHPTLGFTMVSGQALQGLNNQTTTSGTNEDQLFFRYQNDVSGSTRNCLGALVNNTTAVNISSRYFVRSDPTNPSVRTLYCETQNFSIPTGLGVASVPLNTLQSQPLISNIVKFQILYGTGEVDPTSGQKNVKFYQANPTNFSQVIAIRINMIFETAGSNLTPDNQNTSFTYAGMTVSNTNQKLYRGTTINIGLNNQIL